MIDDIAQVSARADALECDIVTARHERDSLRAELVACRAERDRLRLLQDSERARCTARLEAMAAESKKIAQRVMASDQRATAAEQRAGVSARRVDELTAELTAVRATLSWRVTRPLRAVRRWLPR